MDLDGTYKNLYGTARSSVLAIVLSLGWRPGREPYGYGPICDALPFFCQSDSIF